MWEAIKSEQREVKFYEIGRDFLPVTEFPEEAFILVNNYFGVCHANIRLLTKKYKNLLIDNAQGFYDEPIGLASIYSPRKFFGLPDGGILICKKRLETDFEKDISYERMSHLLKRHDLDASAGYSDFKANDDGLSNQPIRKMSNLTHALMGNINYDAVKQKRKEKFDYLRSKLDDVNEIKLSSNIECPMLYPLLIENNDLKKRLIESKVYIATYWAGVRKVAPHDSYSRYLTDNLIPLPIDQRYGIKDMEKIIDILYEKT
jgi:hypothetical protein